jgi:hypothetical protein
MNLPSPGFVAGNIEKTGFLIISGLLSVPMTGCSGRAGQIDLLFLSFWKI